MINPGLLLVLAAVFLVAVSRRLHWPLPLALIATSILAALIAGYGVPFRHLVEGGFGYLNLALGLFAGAFFGQVMRVTGAADAVAAVVVRRLGGNDWLILTFAAALLFLVGMFVGIAGIAVLATGVFVVPLLRRIGMLPHEIGAFIAVTATCGMIAPPVNVPAMSISDGVNMPYAGFGPSLLVLSLPPVALNIVLFALRNRGRARPVATEAVGAAPVTPQHFPSEDRGAALTGALALGFVLGFWTLLRIFPTVIPDPAAPLVLVVGALFALPRLDRARFSRTMAATFSGVPLTLAAVLVAVGVAVQILTLTGMRGWVVIGALSLPPPWTFLELVLVPVLGGVLTSIGTANVLGVPFAFALIGQDMILNTSALSAISALSEFVPPTSIAAALATYIVGDTGLFRVIRASLAPVALIAVLALLMLVFAGDLAALLSSSGTGQRAH